MRLRALCGQTVVPRVDEVLQEAAILRLNLVVIELAELLDGVVADIAGFENRALHVALNREGPLLHVWRNQIGVDQPFHGVAAGRNPVLGGCDRNLEFGSGNRGRSVQLAENIQQAVLGLEAAVGLRGSEDGFDGVVIDIPNGITAADRRLGVAEHVPGEADVGREVVEVALVERAADRVPGEIERGVAQQG